MKKINSNLVLSFITILLFMLLSACNENETILESDSDKSVDQEILEKIVNEDETLESFDLNYNEEDAMSFVLGKTADEIFPIKVGQKMYLVDKVLEVVFEGDTAYGQLTKTFEGVLYIIAADDSLINNDSLDLDIYEKMFSTTIKRNLIFVKTSESDTANASWKLDAISLPAGGTLTENIAIENVIVYLPDGEVITIDSPLEYYLSKGISFRDAIPEIRKYESVEIDVFIKSIYTDQDFVTLTYGAMRGNKHLRSKRRFEYVEDSESFDGTYYHRKFSGEWSVNQYKGYKHAVINAIPWGVIKDSEAPAETIGWGIPYKVK